MRSLIEFPCGRETLVGTLDAASGANGLLIVSGGNEIRIGAHRGMALLAQRLAASDIPVFRYDRRGIGDSTGANAGYEGARDDLIAAAAAFRAAAPGTVRLTGFGNCDAATTLALWGRDAGIDAVVLANPWVIEPIDDLPPSAAIRARYAERLRDPATWRRMATGKVSLAKLIKGLSRLAASNREAESDLAARVLAVIAAWADDATIVLAAGDATAIAYLDAARRAGVAARTVTVDTASHSFARASDAAALDAAIRSAIARG